MLLQMAGTFTVKSSFRNSILCLLIGTLSCKKPDSDPKSENEAQPVSTFTSSACDARYQRDIKPLIGAKCAISGCHQAHFPFGDFTMYSDLKTKVDNGRVKRLVFDNVLMPPSSATQLTAKELEVFKCWMDDGAKDN